MKQQRISLRGIAFLTASILLASTAFAQACPYDLNGSGEVDFTDVALVLSQEPFNGETLEQLLENFGPCPCPGDLDANGIVNGEDLAEALVNYSDSLGTDEDVAYNFNTILTVLANWGNQCDSGGTNLAPATTAATVAATTPATSRKSVYGRKKVDEVDS